MPHAQPISSSFIPSLERYFAENAEQNNVWKADSRSANQEIPRLAQYEAQTFITAFTTAHQSHITDHKFITSFFKICFNIILLCTPRTSYQYFVFFMKLTATFIEFFFSKLALYQIVFGFLILQDWTDRLSWNVGKELTSTRCVITQKSAVPKYFAAVTCSGIYPVQWLGSVLRTAVPELEGRQFFSSSCLAGRLYGPRI